MGVREKPKDSLAPAASGLSRTGGLPPYDAEGDGGWCRCHVSGLAPMHGCVVL